MPNRTGRRKPASLNSRIPPGSCLPTASPEFYGSDARPWGIFRVIFSHPGTCVKILEIRDALSYQYHERRSEYWYILEGACEAIIDRNKIRLLPGDGVYIKAKMLHTIRPLFGEARVLEIATGDIDEQDIVRVRDKYKRSG